MKLPLKYNLRSVTQRKMRSLLTMAGVAVSIFLAVMMIGLSRGLIESTVATGEASNLIVLSKGADSMEFSALDPGAIAVLRTAPQIAVDDGGQTLASPEVFINTPVQVPGYSGSEERLALVRGVLPEVGLLVHPQVKVVEGTGPARGFEIAVGRLAAAKLGLPQEALAIGRQVTINDQLWTVKGIFDAPGTVFESEVWVQLDDFMTAARRDDYSAIVLGTGSGAAASDLATDLALRTDVRVTAISEPEYYLAAASQLKPVQAVSVVMTVILVLGGLLAGMNTMFNSIMGRAREMAVLLVLGYRRRAVLASFIFESVVLCLAGGAVGSLAGFVLNGLPMKIPMGAFRFAIDGLTIGIGLSLALLIGVLGAVLPVMRVSQLSVVEGLRGR